MSSSPVPRPLIAKLFFAALLLLLIWIHVSLRHYAEDDAFIHFRIARNFWEHGAPFFNLDDRVQSSTSLAWIAFLSLLYGLGGLTPTVLAIINSLFVWANIAVWITVLEGWSGKRLRIKNFVITSFALAGSLFPASIALMETPLALLLIGLAFLAHVKGASGWVALFGLAIFTRPEALVFLLPLLFCRTIRSIPGGYRSLSFGAIVLGLGVVLHLFLYGSIAPHTAMVKRLVYDLSITEFTKIFFMASFGENLTQRFLPYYFFSIGVLIIRAIFVANRKHFEEVEPGVYRIAASAILLLICYTAGLSPVFQWYSPLYLVPIVAVTCSLLLGGFQTKHRIAAYILLSAPLAITISCALGAFVDVRAYPWVRSGARVGRYLQIGAAIHNSCPNASLLAPEIGGLGWTFPGTVWDGVGLATSAAL